MNRVEIVKIVCDAVRAQLDLAGDGDPLPSVDETTVLLGSGAVLDSLGLVTVIIEVEQTLFDGYDQAVTLVDEKAMSTRTSPFRTVGALADHAHAAVESGADAR